MLPFTFGASSACREGRNGEQASVPATPAPATPEEFDGSADAYVSWGSSGLEDRMVARRTANVEEVEDRLAIQTSGRGLVTGAQVCPRRAARRGAGCGPFSEPVTSEENLQPLRQLLPHPEQLGA